MASNTTAAVSSSSTAASAVRCEAPKAAKITIGITKHCLRSVSELQSVSRQRVAFADTLTAFMGGAQAHIALLLHEIEKKAGVACRVRASHFILSNVHLTEHHTTCRQNVATCRLICLLQSTSLLTEPRHAHLWS